MGTDSAGETDMGIWGPHTDYRHFGLQAASVQIDSNPPARAAPVDPVKAPTRYLKNDNTSLVSQNSTTCIQAENVK